MARVIIFKRCESFSGERERNVEFRKMVEEFAPFMLGKNVTYSEYEVNTKAGFEWAFSENPECELVFTAENDLDAEYEANQRNILVFEWRCFNDKTFVPVRVKKNMMCGMIAYSKSFYNIHPVSL